MAFKTPATLLCDFYKLSHREMYPENTQYVYSTWTPRTSRIEGVDEVVVFGNQAFIKEYLIDFFNDNFFSRPLEDILNEYTRVVSSTLGVQNPPTEHIEALHELGYLPLFIAAVPEGTVVPLRTPVLYVENTHPVFFWLTNYIESLASCELWPAYTAATIAHEYRKMLDNAAMKTVGNTDFVPFQGHDFSFRGMLTLPGAIKTGMGHLLSFVGTDTIPAICAAEYYYGADVTKELVGTSIPASEHSVECAYDNDEEYFERLITQVHPNGLVSIVSDGRDFWDVIGTLLPKLKDKIMARSGGPVGDKVVIRPDSGDPVKILCGDPDGATELIRKGAVEALWDLFGGTTTEKGYKLLDSHIGLIYGDAITLSRAREIVDKLAEKGFASINVVFGIGSFTYQYNTRDTFGFALKSTYCQIKGEERMIFKDPKTDDGTKKSQKGRVITYRDYNGDVKWDDGYTLGGKKEAPTNVAELLLKPVFFDGSVPAPQTFEEIRGLLAHERLIRADY